MIDQPYAVVAKHLDRRPGLRPEYIRQSYSPSVAAEGVFEKKNPIIYYPHRLLEAIIAPAYLHSS